MDLLDLLGLLLLAATGWLWFDSLKTREMAVSAAKASCNAEHCLLLDDTVAIMRVGLERNDNGVLRIRRIYGFEYSNTGNDRTAGSIVMAGSRVLVINLNLPDSTERIAFRDSENRT
jgi:hypothetical protein